MSELQVSVLPTGQIDTIQKTLERLENLLQDIQENYQPKTPEEYLTRQEASELLKINLSTLWAWTKKGRIQSYTLCGKVYYKRSQIEEVLTSE